MMTRKRHPRAVGATETRLADLAVATKTVGTTHASQLAWVVRFIGEDPTGWHSALRAAHGDCLIALVRPSPPYAEPTPPFSGSEIEALHGQLRVFLRDLVAGRDAMLESDRVTEGLFRVSAPGVKPAIYAEIYRHTSLRSAILRTAKNLILRAGDRLLGCRCGAPFVAIGKQKFCSIACAQRARNQLKAAKRKKGVR